MGRTLALLLTLLLIHNQAFAKIRILTFHCNQADFFEFQWKTLNKFLKDDFELIVFNDAKTEENEKWIEKVCRESQIQCVRFQPQWHLEDPLNTYLKIRLQDPSVSGWGWNASTTIEEIASHSSVRHSHVIQYALDHYGYDHDDIVVLMDGDNFLIKPISIRELLGSKDLIGFDKQSDDSGLKRMEWKLSGSKDREVIWVVFIAFNPRKLPDVREMHFHLDAMNGHPCLVNDLISDTGSAVYTYLADHPQLNVETYLSQPSYAFRRLNYIELKRLGINDYLIRFVNNISPGNVQLFLFEHFMHFSSGSFEYYDHQHKVAHLRRFIHDILKEDL